MPDSKIIKLLIQRFRGKIERHLRIIKNALLAESIETQSMLYTYLHYVRGEASIEEMKVANAQFRSFLKTIGLGALAVLPFSPMTIPLIVKIGERLGIDVLPPSIRKEINKTD